MASGSGSRGRPPVRGIGSRQAALGALVRVEGEGAWSTPALDGELRRHPLSERDRHLATDLVRGTLRWQLALDTLLAGTVSRPLADLDVPVRQGLRLGAYQIVQAGIPAHAAVSTTVGALAAHPGARLVNAALRALTRIGPPWPWPDDPALLSFPAWIRERLADATLRALQAPATTHVRLRQGREAEAEAALPEGAVVGRIVPAIRRLEAGGDPGPLVARGLVTVQDEASAAVAVAVPPAALTVDLCSAPGGKTTAIAERGGGRVLALDLRATRAVRLAAAARRLGLANVAVAVADARRLPLAAVGTGPGSGSMAFLLDAPCSGLGTLRRRPEIRHRMTPEGVEDLANLQRELVRSAARALPPGGALVYSVCTLSVEETTEVGRVLLDELDEARPSLPLVGAGPGGFLLPDVHDTDGMYVLAARRPGRPLRAASPAQAGPS